VHVSADARFQFTSAVPDSLWGLPPVDKYPQGAEVPFCPSSAHDGFNGVLSKKVGRSGLLRLQFPFPTLFLPPPYSADLSEALFFLSLSLLDSGLFPCLHFCFFREQLY
jgi:hypothetical protein